MLVFAFLVAISIDTTIAQTRKYSNEFLSIGVGARALSLSNSTVAIVDDVTSAYWNPAGLVLIPTDVQVSLMHAEYFAGIAKYDYGAFASKIDKTGALGISFIRFAIDGIPDTSELIDAEGNINWDRIKSFSAADYAFIFSYGRKTKIQGLRLGLNAKIIRRKAGDFASSWGFGIDAAAQYDYKNWKFGLMARDITTTFNAWSFNLTDEMKEVFTVTENEIPNNSIELTLPKFIFGASRKFTFFNKLNVLPIVDIDVSTDGKRNVLIKSKPFSIDPHIGLELGYTNIVFLRGGIGNIQKETDISNKKITTFQPNVGIGVNIKDVVSIDYALTDIGNSSIALYSNIFSLKVNLNKIRKASPMK
ncbi:MAG: hypothetical protein AUJ97_04185 [Bacteroidetes bacterium CG2_30_32_10]|nr:MAG: hypothetical protein AUJ97_04185 [Bacteroidetes bacterium CG2_30_32_10]